jgi:hypothetical protein
LLLAFSFSQALTQLDARRAAPLKEANAISNTASFTMMLPEPEQTPILRLLREDALVRVNLGFDPEGLEQDGNRSLVMQAHRWRLATAVAATAPRSILTYRFVVFERNEQHA